VTYDELAERQLAGGVISNPRHGSGFDAVNVHAFYAPAMGRIFALRRRLESVGQLDDRIALAALLVGIEEREVRALVSATTTMWNFGPWATRVYEAALRRRAMMVCSEVYDRLGRGEPLEDALRLLERVAA
jgi:replicative DNA helicase